MQEAPQVSQNWRWLKLSFWQARFEPLAIWLSWRFMLTCLAFAAGALLPTTPRKGTAPFTPEGLSQFSERLLGVWSHWDGEWFLYVAQVGYKPGEATSPFFPLYPVLTRLTAVFFGGNYLVAGVLVSLLASVAAFLLLFELARQDFGELVAARAVLYLAVFPTSFFLAACYSESLFLALALGAFLAARHYSNWWLAGLLVGLAALTRNIGILLLIPLGYEWYRQTRPQVFELGLAKFRLRVGWVRQIRPLSTALFLGLPALLLGSWLLYLWVTLGDPFNFASVQSTPMWNRRSALPWESVWRGFEVVFNQRPVDKAVPAVYREDPNLLDLSFWVFSAVLLLVGIYQTVQKKLPLSYLIWWGIAFTVPLLSPAAKEPLLSAPRFVLLSFPLFIILASLGTRWRLVHYSYLLGAAFLLALLFSRFAGWYWVA